MERVHQQQREREREKAAKYTHTYTHTSVAKLQRVEQHIEQHLRTSVLRGRVDSWSNKKAREREAEKNKEGRCEEWRWKAEEERSHVEPGWRLSERRTVEKIINTQAERGGRQSIPWPWSPPTGPTGLKRAYCTNKLYWFYTFNVFVFTLLAYISSPLARRGRPPGCKRRSAFVSARGRAYRLHVPPAVTLMHYWITKMQFLFFFFYFWRGGSVEVTVRASARHKTVASATEGFHVAPFYCISWVGGKKAKSDAESSYTLI